MLKNCSHAIKNSDSVIVYSHQSMLWFWSIAQTPVVNSDKRWWFGWNLNQRWGHNVNNGISSVSALGDKLHRRPTRSFWNGKHKILVKLTCNVEMNLLTFIWKNSVKSNATCIATIWLDLENTYTEFSLFSI